MNASAQTVVTAAKSGGIWVSDGGRGGRSVGEGAAVGTAPVNLVTRRSDVNQNRRSAGEAG